MSAVLKSPAMNRVDVVRASKSSRMTLVAALLLAIVAATLPWWAPEDHASSWMREFVQIACYFVFAMMWNLLAGYGGMSASGNRRSSASAVTRC